jgi:riboflavin kinase/FMN adenylyltransferase
MKHLYALEDARIERPSLVAVGVFDGVHVGHQHLIRHLVQEAHGKARCAVVLTFFPHPDAVLKEQHGRYYLTSPEQRAEMLIALGVDNVITHPFNDDVRQMSAQTFVNRLLQHLKMASLWVGQDFALGYQREGDVAFLRAQGESLGFTVETIELIRAKHAPQQAVSSTAIRALIAAGDVAEARLLLGRSYEIEGTVVKGDGRGRPLGFPTANLAVWSEQLIPANGVYAGWATVKGARYRAVTNVGTRPTFDGQDVRVEPHLLDFDGDLYGALLRLTFEARLRSEQKFDGVGALRAQLAQDVENARAVLG